VQRGRVVTIGGLILQVDPRIALDLGAELLDAIASSLHDPRMTTMA
jgi:hypothetical protein